MKYGLKQNSVRRRQVADLHVGMGITPLDGIQAGDCDRGTSGPYRRASKIVYQKRMEPFAVGGRPTSLRSYVLLASLEPLVLLFNHHAGHMYIAGQKVPHNSHLGAHAGTQTPGHGSPVKRARHAPPDLTGFGIFITFSCFNTFMLMCVRVCSITHGSLRITMRADAGIGTLRTRTCPARQRSNVGVTIAEIWRMALKAACKTNLRPIGACRCVGTRPLLHCHYNAEMLRDVISVSLLCNVDCVGYWF